MDITQQDVPLWWACYYNGLLILFQQDYGLFLETISSGEADIINNVIVLSNYPETLSVFVIFFFTFNGLLLKYKPLDELLMLLHS